MVRDMKMLGIGLGLLLALSGATAVQAANWRRDCDRKIAHEQRELDRAIDHHGRRSRQAEHERRELDRLYQKCGYRDHDRNFYRDYNGDRYR
jgi:hypothetical protein